MALGIFRQRVNAPLRSLGTFQELKLAQVVQYPFNFLRVPAAGERDHQVILLVAL